MSMRRDLMTTSVRRIPCSRIEAVGEYLVRGLQLVRADVRTRAGYARVTRTALIVDEIASMGAGVDSRAARSKRKRLGRAAVVRERLELRIGADRVRRQRES